METLVKQRIRHYFADEKKLSERAFSEGLGIGQRTFNKQMKEDTSMPLRTILLMLESNPELSAEWLLRGKEPMLLSPIIIENKGINSGMVGYNNNGNIADSEFLQQQIKEKDAQIASLTNILTNLTNKQSWN